MWTETSNSSIHKPCSDIPFTVRSMRHEPSGLTVIVCDNLSPVIKASVCLWTPSSNNLGLPHALEHLIFFGSQRHQMPGYLDVLAPFRMCSKIKAVTASDHTIYSFDAIPNAGSDWKDFLLALMDHIFHPLLPEDAYGSEIHRVENHAHKGVMFCELLDREFDDDLNANQELMRVLFNKNCHLHYDSAGKASILREEQVGIDLIQAYHKDHYRLDNAVLVVTGPSGVLVQELQDLLDPFLTNAPALEPTSTPSFTPILESPEEKNVCHQITLPSTSDNVALKIGWLFKGSSLSREQLMAIEILLSLFKELGYFNKFELLDWGNHMHVVTIDHDFEQESSEESIMKTTRTKFLSYINEVSQQDLVACLRTACHRQLDKVCYKFESSAPDMIGEQLRMAFLSTKYTEEFDLSEEIQKSVGDSWECYEKLAKKDFSFWLGIVHLMTSQDWHCLRLNFSSKLYRDAMKEAEKQLKRAHPGVRRKQEQKRDDADHGIPEQRAMIPPLALKTHATTNNVGAWSFVHDPSLTITGIHVAYKITLSEDNDIYLHVLKRCLLISAKRNAPGVVDVKVQLGQNHRGDRLLLLYLYSRISQDSKQTKSMFNFIKSPLSVISKKDLQAIGQTLHDEVMAFDPSDKDKWSLVPRLKKYIKLMERLRTGKDKAVLPMLDHCKGFEDSILMAQVVSRLDLSHRVKELPDKGDKNPPSITCTRSEKKGCHHVNVTKGIQSGHAMMILQIDDQSKWPMALTFTEYINAKQKSSGEQNGLAYIDCNLRIDNANMQLILCINDTMDMAKSFEALRKKLLSEMTSINLPQDTALEAAKRAAIITQMETQSTPLKSFQMSFLHRAVIGMDQNDTIEHIRKSTMEDYAEFAKECIQSFLHPDNVDVIVMLPKSSVSVISTVKQLASLSIKF